MFREKEKIGGQASEFSSCFQRSGGIFPWARWREFVRSEQGKQFRLAGNCVKVPTDASVHFVDPPMWITGKAAKLTKSSPCWDVLKSYVSNGAAVLKKKLFPYLEIIISIRGFQCPTRLLNDFP
jgi:hypothetical protein